MTSSATDWPDPVPYSELSKRQHEILQYLWTCPSVYSPSFREIGHAAPRPRQELGAALVIRRIMRLP